MQTTRVYCLICGVELNTNYTTTNEQEKSRNKHKTWKIGPGEVCSICHIFEITDRSVDDFFLGYIDFPQFLTNIKPMVHGFNMHQWQSLKDFFREKWSNERGDKHEK